MKKDESIRLIRFDPSHPIHALDLFLLLRRHGERADTNSVLNIALFPELP